jgi:hypothetical protein
MATPKVVPIRIPVDSRFDLPSPWRVAVSHKRLGRLESSQRRRSVAVRASQAEELETRRAKQLKAHSTRTNVLFKQNNQEGLRC